MYCPPLASYWEDCDAAIAECFRCYGCCDSIMASMVVVGGKGGTTYSCTEEKQIGDGSRWVYINSHGKKLSLSSSSSLTRFHTLRMCVHIITTHHHHHSSTSQNNSCRYRGTFKSCECKDISYMICKNACADNSYGSSACDHYHNMATRFPDTGAYAWWDEMMSSAWVMMMQ